MPFAHDRMERPGRAVQRRDAQPARLEGPAEALPCPGILEQRREPQVWCGRLPPDGDLDATSTDPRCQVQRILEGQSRYRVGVQAKVHGPSFRSMAQVDRTARAAGRGSRSAGRGRPARPHPGAPRGGPAGAAGRPSPRWRPTGRPRASPRGRAGPARRGRWGHALPPPRPRSRRGRSRMPRPEGRSRSTRWPLRPWTSSRSKGTKAPEPPSSYEHLDPAPGAAHRVAARPGDPSRRSRGQPRPSSRSAPARCPRPAPPGLARAASRRRARWAARAAPQRGRRCAACP